MTRNEASRTSTAFHAATAILSVLPTIELAQTLSVLLLLAGLLVNGVRSALGHESLATGFGRAMLRLGVTPLWLVFHDFLGQMRIMSARNANAPSALPKLGNWGLTILGAMLFLALFSSANPVLEGWIAGLFSFQIPWPDGWRIAFWLLIAALTWPLIKIRQLYTLLAAPSPGPKWNVALPGVNPTSIAA